jgi:hypothetical protein
VTPAVAPPANPHGKAFYSAVALFALAAECLFASETLAPGSTPAGWRQMIAALTLVFLFGALQAFERVFWPEIARARAQAVPALARRVLRISRRALVAGSLAGFVIAGLMRWTVRVRDMADVMIIAAVLFFAAYCVADLAGERLSQ